jgi:hypothetical protein
LANVDEHYRQIVEEDGPHALMELWDHLGSVYTAKSVNEALSESNVYASRENALWGDRDELPEDEMEIVGSRLKYAEKLEQVTALRAAKKAKAAMSGLRVVPVPVR